MLILTYQRASKSYACYTIYLLVCIILYSVFEYGFLNFSDNFGGGDHSDLFNLIRSDLPEALTVKIQIAIQDLKTRTKKKEEDETKCGIS